MTAAGVGLVLPSSHFQVSLLNVLRVTCGSVDLIFSSQSSIKKYAVNNASLMRQFPPGTTLVNSIAPSLMLLKTIPVGTPPSVDDVMK